MDLIRAVYGVVRPERSKERFDMILEPLQAMTQLALLSYCPVGTKLSIYQNVLYVQEPAWGQAVKRTYNADKKDDLVFLFGIILRFHKFYSFLRDGSEAQQYLFSQLITLAKGGIDKLSETYNHSGAAHLTQTLKMYKTMLDQPDTALAGDAASEDGTTIDTVFGQITQLYTDPHYEVLANVLRLVACDSEHHDKYSLAINSALQPVTDRLQKWISDNIVF